MAIELWVMRSNLVKNKLVIAGVVVGAILLLGLIFCPMFKESPRPSAVEVK
jgi:hypothetical protein